jgi:hypothetical protein
MFYFRLLSIVLDEPGKFLYEPNFSLGSCHQDCSGIRSHYFWESFNHQPFSIINMTEIYWPETTGFANLAHEEIF